MEPAVEPTTPGVEQSIHDIRLEKNQLFRDRVVTEVSRVNDLTELDPKLLKLALSAAKDSDSQILTSRRMEVDSSNMRLDHEIAMAIAKRNEDSARAGGNPFLRKAGDPIPEIDRSKLKEVPLVPGELDVGTSTDTFNQFMDRIEGTGT